MNILQNLAIRIEVKILFSFVGTRHEARSECGWKRKKIATDSLVLQIFEMGFAVEKFAKIAIKTERKQKERTFWHVLPYIFLKILRFFL